MKKKKFKIKLFCFILAVLITACCLYFSSNKLLEEIALNSYSSLISSASYNAIDKMLEPKYDYKSLVSISTDKDGQINMLMTDSYKVNLMASKVASLITCSILQASSSAVFSSTPSVRKMTSSAL